LHHLELFIGNVQIDLLGWDPYNWFRDGLGRCAHFAGKQKPCISRDLQWERICSMCIWYRNL